MQSGNLDKRITISAKTLIDDGLRAKEVFTNHKTVWANVSYLSDAQRFSAGSAGRDLKVRFVIRRIPGTEISHENEIVFSGKAYFIDGAKPWRDDENFIEITAGLRK